MKSAKTIDLKEKLARSGLSQAAIQAAWPAWWSDDAVDSPSAFNDLKFSISRKLGIAPTSLFDEGGAVFVWKGQAKFKGLDVQTPLEHKALVGYATAVARLVLACSKYPSSGLDRKFEPEILRSIVLDGAQVVELSQLLGVAYSAGIPVLCLRVFPLESKRMTAMAVNVDGQYVIFIGREARQSAWLSFYVAHELAHIFRGHLRDFEALVDLELEGGATDSEEKEADEYALSLLTGRSKPEFLTNRGPQTSTELAAAVYTAGKDNRIDPGILALCYAFETKDWEHASGALKCLYGDGHDLWEQINIAASKHLDFSRITEDSRSFLSAVLGVSTDVEDPA